MPGNIRTYYKKKKLTSLHNNVRHVLPAIMKIRFRNEYGNKIISVI